MMSTGFPERLAKQLERSGMSGRALAGAAGVNKNTVVKWLQGQHEPRPKNAKAVASALGISASALLLDDEDEATLTNYEVGAAAGAPSSSDSSSADATAILDRIAALNLEPTLESLRAVVPDLMQLLADANEFARRHGSGMQRRE